MLHHPLFLPTVDSVFTINLMGVMRLKIKLGGVKLEQKPELNTIDKYLLLFMAICLVAYIASHFAYSAGITSEPFEGIRELLFYFGLGLGLKALAK